MSASDGSAAFEAILRDSPVVAVLVIDNADAAEPLAEALCDGGINAVELTLRTDAAYHAIRNIRDARPEMRVGVGTVLTPAQAADVAELGAAFAVSPGLNPAVVEAARSLDLPFAPGIATPSDIEVAMSHGLRVLKYFPAESLGGLKHLAAIAGPYAHTGVSFMPLGGLGETNFVSYLESPLISGVGGSWIAPRADIVEQRWDAIRDRAARAMALAREVNNS